MMFDANAISTMIQSMDGNDLIATTIFICVVGSYRLFLFFMNRFHKENLTLSILQEYRLAWVENHGGNKNPILIVQTLRNSLTTASFFASTSILLMGAAITIFHSLFPDVDATKSLLLLSEIEKIMTVKVLLIVITLSYVFLHFTWYIRETNHLAYMLALPFDVIEKKIDRKAHEHVASLLEQAGFHYSLGIRGYYFAIALFLWLFGNTILYVSLLFILGLSSYAGFT